MNACTRTKTRILLIAPLPAAVSTAANPVGGAAVNCAETVRQLRRRGFELDIVDLTRPRVNLRLWRLWWNNTITGLRVICSVCARLSHNQAVFLNIGTVWPLAPCIWLICIIGHRPLVLRLLGGSYADLYHGYGRIARWCADRTYLRCSRLFVQTRQMLRSFSTRTNVRWFPNTRDVRCPSNGHRKQVRKLLFVSQLRREKGLYETLEACRELPGDCCLTVFGPIMADTDLGSFEGHPRAEYRGVLDPRDVPSVIAEHDVLVLPSYFYGEGYPGIILEALQCGRPVISTWWKSIPEVVQHETCGLLVEPKSAAAIRDAIMRLVDDPALYDALCKGAHARGEYYRSAIWYDCMAADLRRLVAKESRYVRP